MKIICLISDTFRYDHLGCGGEKGIRTPELDEFAEDSTFFENYYLSSFPTIPAREDFFTGRFSSPFHDWQPLEKDEIVLPEVLSDNGYINQLICDTPHLLKGDANYHRGFHAYHWIRGQEGDVYLTRFNHPIKKVMPDDKTRDTRIFGHTLVDIHRWQNWNWQGEEDTFVARTARTACRWIEDNHKLDNFFLWVDTFDAHEPWDPPEELVRLYDPDYEGIPMLHPNYGSASAYSEAELRNLGAHYAGEITLVSRWLGKVLKKLQEVGIYDETLIVFTTDHGMYLGEHNRTGKSNICKADNRGPWPLYEEITHIPLMVRLPGGEGKGKKVKELVQQVDLMPTILDMADIKDKPPLHGKSLLPLIKGESEERNRPYAFSIYAPLAGKSSGGMHWSTVRDKEWAYLVGGREEDKEELYRLDKDPAQENNVAGENKDIARRMKRAYLEFLRSLGAAEERIRRIEEKK